MTTERSITLNIDYRWLEMARLVAPKDDLRHWLNGIFCSPDAIVALNGHVMLRITSPWQADDVPVGVPIDFPPFLLPRELLTGAFKPSKYYGDDLVVTVTWDDFDPAKREDEKRKRDTSHVMYPVKCVIGTRGDAAPRIFTCESSAIYPDYERVIPKEYDHKPAAFDAKYMRLYADLWQVINPVSKSKGAPQPFLIEYNGTGVSRFHFREIDEGKVTFLVMPLQYADDAYWQRISGQQVTIEEEHHE